MPPKTKILPVVALDSRRTLQPLRLRATSSQVLAARRPMVATHQAGTANHARHHAPLKAQG